MTELTIAVKCPLAGFEQVSVVYDMLATEAAADRFSTRLGRDGTHTPIVVRVDGWDAATYGDDPWSREKAPMAFRAWAARIGYGQAVGQFVTDPNSWTGSSPSTPPIATGAS